MIFEFLCYSVDSYWFVGRLCYLSNKLSIQKLNNFSQETTVLHDNWHIKVAHPCHRQFCSSVCRYRTAYFQNSSIFFTHIFLSPIYRQLCCCCFYTKLFSFYFISTLPFIHCSISWHNIQSHRQRFSLYFFVSLILGLKLSLALPAYGERECLRNVALRGV